MIARVSAVMGTFSIDEPVLRVSEIARRTGLAKSVASRIIAALVDEGFLEPSEKGVRVGIRMFELGELAQRSKELRQLALSAMADLRQATNLTVQLSVLDGADQVYVEIFRGKGPPPTIRSRIGGRVPAYGTAGGKAVLAHSPQDVIDHALTEPLEKLGPRTITDPDSIRQQLRRIQAEGLAHEYEESNPGITCVAAAILRMDRSPIAAISITGPAGKVDMSKYEAAVRTTALGLNRRIRASLMFSNL